jgi:hypothetical protein
MPPVTNPHAQPWVGLTRVLVCLTVYRRES